MIEILLHLLIMHNGKIPIPPLLPQKNTTETNKKTKKHNLKVYFRPITKIYSLFCFRYLNFTETPPAWRVAFSSALAYFNIPNLGSDGFCGLVANMYSNTSLANEYVLPTFQLPSFLLLSSLFLPPTAHLPIGRKQLLVFSRVSNMQPGMPNRRKMQCSILIPRRFQLLHQ
jgi:hypothetical protein